MSSSEIVLEVRELAKSYRVAPAHRRPTTLAEALARRVRDPFRRDPRETFWALDDVSFDVRRGDVVGVIGRNGAGKSTLLKIISRITEPTRGAVRLFGRVGSLLEVGTGFHAELTGRENIFLNGSILGMSRADVGRRFDEIVAFAGVERFLDTPVKHYSSGMYVRLAFAVAAHLEPDILLVDEVLAVGDMEFQQRCLGRLREVSRSGRTVLFVSHNLAAIRTLCNRCLVLHRGAVACDGGPEEGVRSYHAGGGEGGACHWERAGRPPTGPLALLEIRGALAGRQPRLRLELDVRLGSFGPHRPAWIAVEILDAAGIAIMQAVPTIEGFIPDSRPRHSVGLTVDLPPLIPGHYLASVDVLTHNTELLDRAKECVQFVVTESPTPNRTYPHTPDHGYVVPASTYRYGDGEGRT